MAETRLTVHVYYKEHPKQLSFQAKLRSAEKFGGSAVIRQ